MLRTTCQKLILTPDGCPSYMTRQLLFTEEKEESVSNASSSRLHLPNGKGVRAGERDQRPQSLYGAHPSRGGVLMTATRRSFQGGTV